MARTRDRSSATLAERFVKSLVVTAKSVVLYPPDSNVPVQTAEKAAELLEEGLRRQSEIRLSAQPDGIYTPEGRVYPGNTVYESFAADLRARGLAEVRFHAGMSARDLVAFLSLLDYSPAEALSMGGFEARLWERGVSSITVTSLPAEKAEDAARVQDWSLDLEVDREDVERLIERLAEEPDSSNRGELLAALSDVASSHVDVLGAHMGDARWYVVRNVVAALGSSRSCEALPYLEEALGHREPRVRREAVRALSELDEPAFCELLTAALSDDDSQNVQLAARYLGSRCAATAVPALERVARGEGQGSRSAGPRAEAIEALGRIGSPEALPTLEEIAASRGLLGGSKTKGLRSAAQSAIVAIKGKGTQR